MKLDQRGCMCVRNQEALQNKFTLKSKLWIPKRSAYLIWWTNQSGLCLSNPFANPYNLVNLYSANPLKTIPFKFGTVVSCMCLSLFTTLSVLFHKGLFDQSTTHPMLAHCWPLPVWQKTTLLYKFLGIFFIHQPQNCRVFKLACFDSFWFPFCRCWCFLDPYGFFMLYVLVGFLFMPSLFLFFLLRSCLNSMRSGWNPFGLLLIYCESFLAPTFLSGWQCSGPYWSFSGDPHKIVSCAYPAGAQIACCVWASFEQLKWRHPDLPQSKKDTELPGMNLQCTSPCLADAFLFGLRLRQNNQHIRSMFFFHQRFEASWHQATNLRKKQLYPRYIKTGASTMVRLRFHRSLIGGIAARPTLRQSPKASKSHSSTWRLCRLARKTLSIKRSCSRDKLNCSQFMPSIAETLTFSQRHNLYQWVRKCMRNKLDLDTIQLDQ